ncbi:TPA: hypothetical protein ON570_004978 [Citrobacter werkmanii]|nr:hypothetical protein [Citrobacter werkmanii]
MLNLFKYIIAVLTFKSAYYNRQNEALQAPLGLMWGLSFDEIKKEVEVLSESIIDDRTKVFVFTPKEKTFNFDEYELTVDDKYGLIEIKMVEYFNCDNFDTQGKGSYYDFNKILSKKYGPPASIRESESAFDDYNSHESRLDAMQNKDTDYLLKNEWSSFYSFKFGGWITVSLKNNSPDNNFLELIYSSSYTKKVIREQVDKEKEKMSELL